MIVRGMTATFGGLDNATVTFREGLNILELPNEGGKSTWCAFLRAMLYGLESRKGGAQSERNHYTPWSGKPMSGTMEVTWQGRDITLRRFAKGSDPFGGFEAVYTGTMEPVPGLTGSNAGETLLGVSKEVYERTAFIPQGGMAVDNAGDLEKRIASLATSGEEDVAFSDAEERLKKWRNARRASRGSAGAIPRRKAEADEIAARLRQIAEARSRVTAARDGSAELEREKREAEAELRRHEAVRAAAYRKKYEDARDELELAQVALENRRAELEELPEVAAVEIPRVRSYWMFLPLAGVGGAAACLALATQQKAPAETMLGLTLLSVAVGLILGLIVKNILGRGRKRAYAEAKAQAAAARQEQEKQVEEAVWKLEAAQKVFGAASAQGEPREVPPPDRPPQGNYEEVHIRFERLREELARRNAVLAQAQGTEQAMGNYEELTRRQEELGREIDRLEKEHSALELAMDALTAANAKLQSRYAPAVSGLAGEYLARLTGGRYEKLTFDRDLHAAADSGEGPREAWLLSQGTTDQVYLALRLAVCELTLPTEDRSPLVLDDALVSFDDQRAKTALELLKELSQTRQVLLFTCHSREKTLLDG